MTTPKYRSRRLEGLRRLRRMYDELPLPTNWGAEAERQGRRLVFFELHL